MLFKVVECFQGEIEMVRRRSERLSWQGSRVVPALLVVALGIFFLLSNFGIAPTLFDQPNWWAWLILIAAISPLSAALQHYQSAGIVDRKAWHSLLTAAVIVMVALMFILQLSWQRWWPVFVIYGGLCMLTRGGRSTLEDKAP
jgi:hypothetical protein